MPRVWPFVHIEQDYEDETVRGGEPSAPPGGSGRAPDPAVERVLKMVEAGQLSAKDAAELLRAMEQA
jgi:hypothetical protein